MREFAAKTWNIVWKDVLSELRTRDTVTSVFIFTLLVIVVFNFSFEPSVETLSLVAPGVLWVAFTFAGMLSLNRSFALEMDRGCLEGLMLCPVDRSVIYLGKMLASLIFMLAVEVIALPIFLLLFDLPLFAPQLLLIAFLATLGFATVGTLFSAIAVNTRAREILLPLLLFPIVIPVIIAAVEATGAVFTSKPWESISSWIGMLAAFDLIFLVVSSLTFEFVVEE